MPFEHHPLLESDLEAYHELNWQAFNPGIMAAMFPNGYTQADRDCFTRNYLKEWHKNPETMKLFRVVDTELPDHDPLKKIVGIARWKLQLHPRSEAEVAKDEGEYEDEEKDTPPSIGPAMADFHHVASEARQRIMGGKPYIFLHILATLPRYHGRGVGSLNLEWGLQKADKLGLPVYLESSPAGKPLYERRGFEVVEWLPWDARTHGYHDELRHAVMVRPARAAP